MQTIIIILGAVLVGSCLTTLIVLRVARAKGSVVIPNERSSHSVPTPSGGGLGVAVGLIGGIIALNSVVPLALPIFIALIAGGTLVAAVGWIDDMWNVPATIRMFVYGIAALLALTFLGPLSGISTGFGFLPFGIFGTVITFLVIVWASNLYNFMDGIDGLVGSGTMVLGIVLSILLFLGGAVDLAPIALIIAASSAGFLVWNWPPAKIFMGDSGSVLIGYTFSVLAIIAALRGAVPLLISAMLFSPYIVDTTATTLRRMRNRERWYAAHRTFSYQLAVMHGRTHRRVSVALIGILLVVSGATIVAFYFPATRVVLFIMTYVLLFTLWRHVQREQ
jgi:Fuc2NAc and GlcNAc transferase